MNKEQNLYRSWITTFLWVNSSIWESQVSWRREEHMPNDTDKPHTHIHTLDRTVLSFLSLLILCCLPVTILKTSLSMTNPGYLFSHTTARRCIIFFFSLELTSSHSCTHSRNRTERSRKKKDESDWEREREKGRNCNSRIQFWTVPQTLLISCIFWIYLSMHLRRQ